MNKIILVGAGGHAVSCIDVIHQEKKFKIIGLIDNNKNIGSKFCNYKILGKDKDLKKLRKYAKYAFISIGQIGVSNLRKKIFLNLLKHGFKIPKIISPHSYVSKNAIIDKGSMILHGAIVNSEAKIGQNCIINNKALIEHGVTIGNHTHVATSATVNGDVKVGDECFLGSGCVVKNNIKIKKKTFIKMGEIVK